MTIPIPVNTRFLDLRGQSFGRLTVKEYRGRQGKHQLWLCACDCSQTAEVTTNNLRSGHTTSCGCYQAEIRGVSRFSHGESYGYQGRDGATPEYMCWQGIKRRCIDPNDKSFARYGARGIVVCDRWLNGDGENSAFECFLMDMGRKPSRAHSIDRINYLGNYEPDNCRWATSREQNRNRRDTVRVKLGGRMVALADACDELGCNYNRVRDRMHRGWSFQRAVSEPPHWRGR